MPLLAQGQSHGQGSGQGIRVANDSPNDPSTLLTSESVQKELTLTDEQKASLQKLRDDCAAAGQAFFESFMGQPQDEIQKRMEERAKDSRNKISKILTPKQMERLDEINIQISGVVALNYEDVAEKLALTVDQRQKLKNLGEESRRQLTDMFSTSNGQPPDKQKRQELQQKQKDIKSQRKENAMALLTDEQKSKFEQLQGEKFDLSSIRMTYESFGGRGQINAPNGLPAR